MISAAIYQVPDWWNASLIEIIWTFSGIVTIIVTTKHMRFLYREFQFSKGLKRPSLVKIAFGYFRREMIRFCQGCIIVSIGIYSDILPPQVHGKDYISPVGILLTAGLFALGITAALMSHWDWQDHVQLDEMAKKGINGHG